MTFLRVKESLTTGEFAKEALRNAESLAYFVRAAKARRVAMPELLDRLQRAMLEKRMIDVLLNDGIVTPPVDGRFR